MMAAAEQRDSRLDAIEKTRRALDTFEDLLARFSEVLDDIEQETRRQGARRKRWL
ncbi:hypothetical protein ACIA5H_37570 [Nocardia sp. NPDC051900]|uniref:hypothetical protein n=1 Tax=Nocardia sp. NPDC051900 TaxID=3364326 RepID=UPI00379E1BE3